MREIKFRAIPLNSGLEHFIYGHLHVIDTPRHGFTGLAIQQQNGKNRPYSIQVNKDTVGQYTGLKDKYSINIYEGDIVEMVSMGPGGVDLKGVVEMAEGSFYICSHENQLSTYLYNELSVIKIIGNIHEHPHLLGASE